MRRRVVAVADEYLGHGWVASRETCCLLKYWARILDLRAACLATGGEKGLRGSQEWEAAEGSEWTATAAQERAATGGRPYMHPSKTTHRRGRPPCLPALISLRR